MDNLKVLFTQDEIDARETQIAKALDEEYKGKEIVAVCILNGAVFFAVDIMKKMETVLVFDTLQVSSYVGTESTGNVVLKKDIEADVKGKDVLVLEDIIDTGKTLKFVKDHLMAKGPNSVKICTLVDKKYRREEKIESDYNCFTIENKFVVGYGFDIDGVGRNIPYIGYIEE